MPSRRAHIYCNTIAEAKLFPTFRMHTKVAQYETVYILATHSIVLVLEQFSILNYVVLVSNIILMYHARTSMSANNVCKWNGYDFYSQRNAATRTFFGRNFSTLHILVTGATIELLVTGASIERSEFSALPPCSVHLEQFTLLSKVEN